jgi:AcrR family transcriptional regulator
MAMIAERANVGAGTIYRYFENKEVLITELYGDIEKSIMTALQEDYSIEKPFRERFLHLGTELLHHFIGNPFVFRYLEQFHNSPYGVAVRRDKILGTATSGCNVFRDLFQEGKTQQILKDLPLVILFALFFGPVLSVARDHILGFVVLDEIIIHQIIEACWDAVKR